MQRLLKTQPAVRFPRTIHAISVESLEVIDLRAAAGLDRVGLTQDDVADDDHAPCQVVGEAAAFLRVGGVLARSATGAGDILAVYLDNIAPDQLLAIDSVHQPDESV
jgi:RES domain-containing protein